MRGGAPRSVEVPFSHGGNTVGFGAQVHSSSPRWMERRRGSRSSSAMLFERLMTR
jgi:hypothetical protein